MLYPAELRARVSPAYAGLSARLPSNTKGKAAKEGFSYRLLAGLARSGTGILPSKNAPKPSIVIPGRGEASNPESITPGCGYGFRARAKERVPE
jgi:hypothetical protein